MLFVTEIVKMEGAGVGGNITLGVDVSKNRLDAFELETGEGYSIPHALESIERWLDRWAEPIGLAIEPTNCYHEAVAQAADARGHQVYLIDAQRLTHYRQGVGQRVKADRQDAHLLARYTIGEMPRTPRWVPLQHERCVGRVALRPSARSFTRMVGGRATSPGGAPGLHIQSDARTRVRWVRLPPLSPVRRQACTRPVA